MPAADLCALVVTLRATEAHPIEHHLGRAAQALCLALVNEADPALAEAIHARSQTQPYTVSGLLRPGETTPLEGYVKPGDGAWLRLAGLSREVVAALDAFAQHPSAMVEIDHELWAVEDVTVSDHPWAGRATCADLLAAYHTALPPRRLSLEFAAPTGFHSMGHNMPLPLPSLVFGSLLRQWRDLGNIPLPDALADFIDWHIRLSRCHVDTRLLTFKRGSKQVGFVGEATFEIARRNRHLERTQPELAGELVGAWDHLARAVGLLADFAFYAGVGIKTTQGMGLVRAP